MKENKNMITDDMLVDYLLGESTAEEKQQVEQWLNESDANRAHFEQFKTIWAGSALANNPVNEYEAWAKFQHSIAQKTVATRTLSFTGTTWLRAAAILLLFIGIGAFAYLFNTKNNSPEVSPIASVPIEVPAQPKNEIVTKPEVLQEPAVQTISKPKTVVKELIASNEKPVIKKKISSLKAKDDCKTNQFVCNGTSCPLQICIVQKSNCDKDKPYAISNCSIIEPDQSGQLCYKAKDEQFYRNCALTVEEVRITRVSTGETIVLNAHTSPMTAQDFFNYITGKKKGEIVAGAFESDCDNVCNEHDLRIDNSYGGLLFR